MDNIIKAEDYHGTLIYDALVSGDKSEQVIRETITNNLRKGLITQEQFEKANTQLDDLIKAGKKTGAGSRGGHVIGYTKSGKPVYKGKDQASAKEYKDFSGQDHLDALSLHRSEGSKHDVKAGNAAHSSHFNYENAMSRHHRDAANSHEQVVHSQTQKEHESGLSPDEKKIIADQKKKQIDHHDKSYQFHKDMVIHNVKMSEKYGTMVDDTLNHHRQQAQHHKSEKERLEKE